MEVLIFFYFFNFLKSFEIDLILTPELSRDEIKWAKEYKTIFEFASTKLLVTCLEFLLKKTSRRDLWTGRDLGRDLWTRFWALINNPEVPPLKERLAGTPFANLTICHETIKNNFDNWRRYNSYDKCLFLACSGDIVR